MILFRSEVRRKKLELFNKPSMLTKEGVDGMKEEVQGVGGGHSGMEAASGVQRGAEEGGGEGGEGGPGGGREDTMPLEAGLDGALTCPFCRLACSKAANLKRHRYVTVLCVE